MDKNNPNSYILTVLLLGLFGGGFGVFYLMFRTFISIDMACLYILIFGALALGSHFIFFKRDERHLVEVFLYCIIGWGLGATALFLGLNYLFHSEPTLNKYMLKNGNRLDVTFAPSSFEIKIEDKQFDDYGYLLTIQEDEVKCEQYATEAWITEARGLFGYRVIINKELH